MQTLITINFFVFILILAPIGVAKGLDLKKWSTWLFGLYAFLSGFLMTFIRTDEDLATRLMVGAVCTFAVIFAGVIIRRNKQIYTKEYVDSVKEAFDKRHRDAQQRREEKSGRHK